MKTFCLILVCLSVFLSQNLTAEIKKSELGKQVALTQEALLLQQVDTVSLYLSSDKVAFAPKLSGDRIEVETTLLDPTLAQHAGETGSYVARLVDTFINVLKERLPSYAPSLAKSFDPKKDILFMVNSGAERLSVGTWRGGVWASANTPSLTVSSPKLTSDVSTGRAAGTKTLGQGTSKTKDCDCPAKR